MKVQELAIIFVIIILPISIVISAYTQHQIQTINTQSVYDAKLTAATYDAIKAFQINTANDKGSDLANSKMNDIERSVRTFKTSLMSSFGLNGYTEEEMNNYIPALVYTLYDGFYIYSPYENVNYQGKDGDGEKMYGLKPYINYSCRYKGTTSKGEVDVVITYALDNYITVQGTINKEYINDSGYLIDGIRVEGVEEKNYKVYYNGEEITTEKIEEYLPVSIDGIDKKSYPYVKLNGTKYYRIEDKIVFFTNDGIKIQAAVNEEEDNKEDLIGFDQWARLIENNNMAKEYYYNAYQFTERFKSYGLGEIKFENAYGEVIDEDGNIDYEGRIWEGDTRKVFDFSDKWKAGDYSKNIENESSSFNEHRLGVIRKKIETNLAIAIKNFNEYSGAAITNEFQMPELKDDEWDYITHNISLISFLQGLHIGGKVYNGYTLVTNSESEEVVLEESIYILGENGDGSDKEYYRIGDKGFKEGTIKISSEYGKSTKNSAGRLNLDFKRKKMLNSINKNSFYYYPLKEFDASYSSIVMQDKVTTYDDIYKYVNGQSSELKTAFYTALGRERYGQYKTYIKNIDEITKNLPYITISYYDPQDSKLLDLFYKYHEETKDLNTKNPEKEGWTFLGWSTDPDATEPDHKYDNGKTYKEDKDLNLYAVWERVIVDVIYHPNLENTSSLKNMPSPNPQKVEYGGTVTISKNKPTHSDYVFLGWSTEPGATKADSNYEGGKQIKNITKKVNLYAIWELKNYTITYNANGGTGAPAADKKTHGVDYPISSTVPKKEGYKFEGWLCSADNKIYTAPSSYKLNQNATMTAQWKIITYTITYNANGGSGAPANQTKEHGKSIKLSSTIPTRTGYTFKGWAISTNGSVKYKEGATYSDNASVTLYAKWEIIKYTIKYNANGGSGAPANQTKEYGKSITLSSTIPTKTGYTFKGWATSTNGSVKYKAGATYSDNASITLYAKWEASSKSFKGSLYQWNDDSDKSSDSFGSGYSTFKISITATKKSKKGKTPIDEGGTIYDYGYVRLKGANGKTVDVVGRMFDEKSGSYNGKLSDFGGSFKVEAKGGWAGEVTFSGTLYP